MKPKTSTSYPEADLMSIVGIEFETDEAPYARVLEVYITPGHTDVVLQEAVYKHVMDFLQTLC